jgi:GDPmannose 4,6-dehydratase
MWKILQNDNPDDFVIGSGTDLSVRQFLELAFEHVGLDWEKHVRFDEQYLRPSEVDSLVADASKARTVLKWEPSITPNQLVKIMVDHDLAALDGFLVDKPVGTFWD